MGDEGEGEVAVTIAEDSDVAVARLRVRALARRLGFAAVAVESLATAVTEVARNILVHATRGELTAAPCGDGARRGIVVVARDRGPGIEDRARALEGGYSSGEGLGFGLSGARRLVDELELSSTPGVGTTVVLRKWLP